MEAVVRLPEQQHLKKEKPPPAQPTLRLWSQDPAEEDTAQNLRQQFLEVLSGADLPGNMPVVSAEYLIFKATGSIEIDKKTIYFHTHTHTRV